MLVYKKPTNKIEELNEVLNRATSLFRTLKTNELSFTAVYFEDGYLSFQDVYADNGEDYIMFNDYASFNKEELCNSSIDTILEGTKMWCKELYPGEETEKFLRSYLEGHKAFYLVSTTDQSEIINDFIKTARNKESIIIEWSSVNK